MRYLRNETLLYLLLALFLPVYLLVSLVWGDSVARNRPCKGLCVTVVDSAQAQYVSADEIRTYLEKYVLTDKKTILAEINTEEMEALLSENAACRGSTVL